MSRAQPTEPQRDLPAVITDLQAGRYHKDDVQQLSDLTLDEGRFLTAEWSGIPEDIRRTLIVAAADMAEWDIGVDFGRLYRVALEDASPVIRQLAILGLWEDEGGDLRDSYLRLLTNDESPDVRAEAAVGLGRFVDLISTEATDPEVISTLLAAADDPSESLWVRRRALESVSGAPTSPLIEELIEMAFADDDSAVRAGGLVAMGRTGKRQYLSQVLSELVSDDAELRFLAAVSAGLIGDESAVPSLIEALEDEELEVRAAAIAALGQIGGPAAVRALRALQNDDEGEAVEAVEEALDQALLKSEPLRELA